MRRNLHILLSVLLLTLAMGFTVYADEFTISQTKATVNIGDTVNLDISGSDKVPYFTSYNVNIAKVDQNGIVTAVRKGKTTISARIGLTYKKCTVTVVDSSIKLNKASTTIYAGGTSTKTVQLKATVRGASKVVQWESLNPAVATVDEKGKVTSVSSGTTVITATANGKTASCSVTVKESSISLNMDSMQLSTKGNGSSMKLTPSITGSSRSVKWTTSDKTIATVSGGRVTGRNTGTAIITATANGVSATCEVNVIKGSISINEEKVLLYRGETKQLKTNAGKKDVVTWSSSDDTVITVDEKGKVTAVGAGTAVIHASLNDTTDTCEITVKNTTTEIEEETVSLKTKGTDKTYTLHYDVTGRSSSVKWTSSNSRVASVSKGKITTKGAGTAIITAKANGVADTMEVNVSVYDPTIKLNQPEYTLYTKKGNTYTLKASVDGPVKKAVWESSNPEVATVVNGKVTAVGEGQTVITASANGVAAECLITVKESKVILGTENITLDKGETAQLPADVVGYSQTLKYATTNSKVATVKNGTITAKNYGEADIKVTANGIISVCHVKVAACEHVYDEGIITKEATCTELGIRTFTCTLCGDIKKEIIPLKDHEYSNSSVIEPTCTERGYTTYTCSECGDSYVDTYVNALGHDWGEWITTKEPTETETGKKKHICSRCKEEETEDIPVVIHEHQYSSVVTEPTCTEKGYTTHTCSECGHSYVDTYTNALGHNYELVTTKEATCTEEGIEAEKCTRCGDVLATATIYPSHTWGDWTVTKEPASGAHTTVSDFGTQKRACSICGQTEEVYIINIDLGNGETKTLYGSFKDDEAYKTLDMINDLRTSLGLNEVKWETKFEDIGKIRSVELHYLFSHTRPNGRKAEIFIDEDFSVKLGENIAGSFVNAADVFEAWKGSSGHYANMVNPTTNRYYCACFTVMEYDDFWGEDRYGRNCWVQLFFTIDADDTCEHDYTDVVTEPTCTEQGYTTHTCSKCGDTYVDTYTDALGHEYTDAVTEPTCTEQGYTTHTCSKCGDNYVDSYTDAAGHDYIDVVTEPTCTEQGYTTHTCSKCGDSFVDTYTEASGEHDEGEWVTTKEPDVGVAGLKELQCTKCGYVLGTEEIEMLTTDGTDSVYYFVNSDGSQEMTVGHYNEDEAQEMLTLVNNYREENGLDTFTMPTTYMSSYTDLRAAETSYLWDHARPSGAGCEYAENIAMGQPDGKGNTPSVQEIFDAWVASSGHKENLDAVRVKNWTCISVFYKKCPVYNSAGEVSRYVYTAYWVETFK